MISEKTQTEGVWWLIVHEHPEERGAKQKQPVYTKAALWFDARASLGGHPQRVLDEKVCQRLDRDLAEMDVSK